MQTGRDESAQQFQWQSNKYYPRGKKLFDFITLAELITLTVMCASTFIELGKCEVINLIICNQKMLE